MLIRTVTFYDTAAYVLELGTRSGLAKGKGGRAPVLAVFSAAQGVDLI